MVGRDVTCYQSKGKVGGCERGGGGFNVTGEDERGATSEIG